MVNTDVKQLFADLRNVVDHSTDIPETVRVSLHTEIAAMEAEAGKPGFAQKYASFMQHAANHATVFYPFLQALTQILTGAN